MQFAQLKKVDLRPGCFPRPEVTPRPTTVDPYCPKRPQNLPFPSSRKVTEANEQQRQAGRLGHGATAAWSRLTEVCLKCVVPGRITAEVIGELSPCDIVGGVYFPVLIVITLLRRRSEVIQCQNFIVGDLATEDVGFVYPAFAAT